MWEKIKEFKESSDNKFIIWFEDEGKGSIKNKYGETFYYESKYVFEDGGAKGWARDNNKNVLVQRGRMIWRVTPEGDIIELKENEDFNIIESIKKKGTWF